MSSSIGHNPTFSLLATRDEILSWMIETWMEKHLVSDSNCNSLNPNPPKNLQGMTINVRLAFSVGDTTPRLTISHEQDN